MGDGGGDGLGSRSIGRGCDGGIRLGNAGESPKCPKTWL